MKVSRIKNKYKYKTEDGTVVFFEECSLGKHKGEVFMIEETTRVTHRVKILDYEDIPTVLGNGKVRIVNEVDIKEKYSYKDVFFSVARKTTFTVDGKTKYRGYTFNRHWNGWDMPMFEKSVTDKLLKNSDIPYTFDEKEDKYILLDRDRSNPLDEEYQGFDILTEQGESKHVYDIGSGSWTWEET